ncbi:MAG: hypothetical protein KBB32_01550 [Spirochaetia bacterium]|nr:hypothetical protein [Spirochaetia bacterium]
MKKTWEVKKPESDIQDNYLKAPNFFWGPAMFKLKPIAFLILQYFIKNTYGWKKNDYSVGIDQIAFDCNLNRKTTSKYVQVLLDGGWLEIVKPENRHAGTTRVYKLIHGYIEMDA